VYFRRRMNFGPRCRFPFTALQQTLTASRRPSESTRGDDSTHSPTTWGSTSSDIATGRYRRVQSGIGRDTGTSRRTVLPRFFHIRLFSHILLFPFLPKRLLQELPTGGLLLLLHNSHGETSMLSFRQANGDLRSSTAKFQFFFFFESRPNFQMRYMYMKMVYDL
jgi:hypothetical protein